MTDLAVYARALTLGLWYRLRLRWRPVQTLNLEPPRLRSRRSHADVQRLSTAVGRTARLIPGQTCLPRAYTMCHLMHAHGHPADLRFGVATGGPDGFRAHAWVEDADGRVVHGATTESFERLR